MILITKNNDIAQEIAKKLDTNNPIKPVFVHDNRVALAGVKNLPNSTLNEISQDVVKVITNHHSAIVSS